MAELQLKSWRFRQEREADWRRLEGLLARLEGGSIRRLADDEIIALPVLYRQALSSLSVARATSLDQGMVDYLESLCTRAYFYVYGARANLVERLGRFFAQDWPNAARNLWRESLLCAALLILGGVVAYVMVMQDPDWFYAMMPQGMAQGRDPTATAEALRATLYPKQTEFLSAFAVFLFTHNATVAILAFSLGFAFCVLPLVLMVTQGASTGALIAVYAKHGMALQLIGWLMIHGVTELWAIIIAGGAGVRIGWTLAFPGDRTRLEAMAAAGRQAATAMCGVVIMLFVAGLLEGIGRQLIQVDWVRFAIAGTTAAIWGLYLYAPRQAKVRHGD
jgi:uncharacterized membrane protein SpoIIM required for sporulation